MRRRSLLAALATTGVLLTGCGGGDGTADPGSDPSPVASASAPQGVQDPSALRGFHCAKGEKGRWDATGTLRNVGEKAASYRVTVHVGPADGSSGRAVTQSYGPVKAGGTTRVLLPDLKPSGSGASCHVQVLRTG